MEPYLRPLSKILAVFKQKKFIEFCRNGDVVPKKHANEIQIKNTHTKLWLIIRHFTCLQLSMNSLEAPNSSPNFTVVGGQFMQYIANTFNFHLLYT